LKLFGILDFGHCDLFVICCFGIWIFNFLLKSDRKLFARY